MQPGLPQSVRFELTKFSHTITTNDRPGPMAWTHVNGNGDLACLLDKFEESKSAPLKLIMRVTQNNNVLEQIDLAYYVRTNQPLSGQNASSQKSPFAVVVKLPCLAVKYPQGGLRVRRLQIKFRHEPDYYTALAALSEIKCPLTEGNTSAQVPRRAPSTSSWTSAQGSVSAAKDMSMAMTTANTTPLLSHFLPQKMATPNPPSPSSKTTYRFDPTAVQRLPEPQTRFPNSGSDSINIKPDPAPPPSQIGSMATKKPNTRSTTAPACYDEAELNQMLPPKRLLPFAKPSQKRLRTDTSSQPDTAQPPAAAAGNAFIEATNSQTPAVLTGPNVFERTDSFLSDSQSQPLIPTQPYPGAEAEMPFVAPELQVQSTQAYLHPYPATANEQPLGRAMSAASTARIRANDVFEQRQPAPEALEDQLALYMSQPTAERIVFLENWMCELIEDDKFMKLCQDVEGTWRRFAFGIKKS